jgi:hypothetical protein
MINKIENRLQFIITILVFFLVIFPKPLLVGCILVAAYVLDYIIFAIVSEKIDEKWLRRINYLVLTGIGSYIFPLTLIALSTQNGIMSWWQWYAWVTPTFISILLMALVPVALLVILLVLGIDWRNKFR